MNLITLSPLDLSLAASLILLLAFISWKMHLDMEKTIIFSAIRMVIQLTLIGMILNFLFNTSALWLISIIVLVMLSVAGYEVMSRQKHTLKGWRGYGISTLSMFISSMTVLLLAVIVILQNDPWYTPQYLIPLLGMILGNTMTSIALSIDRFTTLAMEQKCVIEARLLLGEHWYEAIAQLRHEAIRTGLMPIINSMAAAGIVSLPGMMTGQILSGTPPIEAVKYQILIMFLIAGATGIGTIIALWLVSRSLFDHRERLRLDRLT